MTPAEVLASLAAATVSRVSVHRPADGLVQVEGAGSLAMTRLGPDRLDLLEEGTWRGSGDGGTPVSYTDALRFNVSPDGTVLTVEETRRGTDHPVLLAELERTARALVSVRPVACGADSYSLRVAPTPGGVALEWTIAGPQKDERVVRRYLVR